MSMIPETLFNTNAIIDGISFAGEVPSLTLPKITIKTEDFRAGGMDGSIKMDQGIELGDVGFVTTGIRKESLKFCGLADQTAFNASFRGSFKGQKGAFKGVIATIRGMLTEVDPGDWKGGEKAEFKHVVNTVYYKLEIDSEVIYEIDIVNGIRIIDGVDQLATMRTQLGL